MNAKQPQHLTVNQVNVTNTDLPTTIQFNANEIYLSTKEAMALLQMSRSSLHRHCKNNKLPYCKLGGTMIFPKLLLQNFIITQCASKVHLTIQK